MTIIMQQTHVVYAIYKHVEITSTKYVWLILTSLSSKECPRHSTRTVPAGELPSRRTRKRHGNITGVAHSQAGTLPARFCTATSWCNNTRGDTTNRLLKRINTVELCHKGDGEMDDI